MDFDVVVVGSGMFGTSAAKYIQGQNPALKVLLLGPWNAELGRSDFFSSHDDVSRLYRHQTGAADSGSAVDAPLSPADLDELSSSQFWSRVSSSSIQRFDNIAVESSVTFHYPVGFLAVGHSSSPYMDALLRSASSSSTSDPVILYKDSYDAFHSSFPYILSPITSLSPAALLDSNPVPLIPSSSFAAVHLPANAGYLNPLALISAQRRLFVNYGGSTLDSSLCTAITQAADHVLVWHVPVLGTDTSLPPLKCGRVLIAAGAFSQTLPVSKALLSGVAEAEAPKQSAAFGGLSLHPKTQVVALFEVSVQDVQVTMKGMPTIVYAGLTKGQGEYEEELDSAYVLPPIYYAVEEKWYVKIGHGKRLEQGLDAKDSTELQSWYKARQAMTEFKCNSRSVAPMVSDAPARALTHLFHRLFPTVSPLSIRFLNAGLTADTDDGKPSIRMGAGGLDRVGVCAGGNGYGAKACDEIGRLAAELFC
jgi:sarcosine oxidase/L-pipecolate oxidase